MKAREYPSVAVVVIMTLTIAAEVWAWQSSGGFGSGSVYQGNYNVSPDRGWTRMGDGLDSLRQAISASDEPFGVFAAAWDQTRSNRGEMLDALFLGTLPLRCSATPIGMRSAFTGTPAYRSVVGIAVKVTDRANGVYGLILLLEDALSFRGDYFSGDLACEVSSSDYRFFSHEKGTASVSISGDGATVNGFKSSGPRFEADGSAVPTAAGLLVGSQETDRASEKLLGRVPAGVVAAVTSDDGLHVAAVVQKGDVWFVVIDGRPGPGCDAISKSGPVFSPDGKRVAYEAQKDDTWLVVIDGQAGPEYDLVGNCNPVFSSDGKRVAYEAQKGRKQLAVIEGQPGPGYDAFSRSDPVFSPDGKRVAYEAQKGDKWFVVTDGQPGPEYDAIGEGDPVFSPDGERIAYRAQKDDKWFVVVDGQPGPEYDAILEGGPAFLSDGSLEYLAIRSGSLYRVSQ